MHYCPICGSENEEGRRFCAACGAPLRGEARKVQAPDAEPYRRAAPRDNAGMERRGTSAQRSHQTDWNTDNPGEIKEDRNLVKFWLLSVVTCGGYRIYTYYKMREDINIICDGDGEQTAGIVKLILLSFVTLGIYSLYWNYRFMQRIWNNADRYGIEVKTLADMELAPAWLVLEIGGILLMRWVVGIVPILYADYLLLENMNQLSSAYNGAIARRRKVRARV